ncbi:MAG: sulfotransferase domain-containing protein [Rhodospirillales bacterium]|jgi:aryl sulfotransferase|nr:sulfotransferase domain-containing protein [Rhodospirillales bacterium]MDP6841640.1 sulfotransferase domain-containing protein [Rhodospirillales bacterium]
MDGEINWPRKTREMQIYCMDSTYWNDFKFRDDDIIIATWGKSGTTWVQQIVAQFIFNGETEGLPVGDMSMWVDFRLPPLEVKMPLIEAQEHRRFLKTHLPVDALVFSPKAKYIYVGRDGRDSVWSTYNHHVNQLDWVYEALNELPYMGPVVQKPTTTDMREYFYEWYEKEGYPFWPFWENVRSWWEVRNLPNVMMLHFQNLKNDMEGEMRRVGEFLGCEVDESQWEKMVLHCTFDFMKKNAPESAPLQGSLWEGGAETFVNKGTNGRWLDTLTDADVAVYEKRADDELGADCARWLATGEM